MGIIEYLKMVRATPVWDRVPAISDTELDAMIDILQKNKSINGVLILKCEECNGTGYVAIAPGVRGIRKCSMCNGTGEITTIPPSQTKVNTEQQRFPKSLGTCRRSRKSTEMLVSCDPVGRGG